MCDLGCFLEKFLKFPGNVNFYLRKLQVNGPPRKHKTQGMIAHIIVLTFFTTAPATKNDIISLFR